jgi:hypothetical protein
MCCQIAAGVEPNGSTACLEADQFPSFRLSTGLKLRVADFDPAAKNYARLKLSWRHFLDSMNFKKELEARVGIELRPGIDTA